MQPIARLSTGVAVSLGTPVFPSHRALFSPLVPIQRRQLSVFPSHGAEIYLQKCHESVVLCLDFTSFRSLTSCFLHAHLGEQSVDHRSDTFLKYLLIIKSVCVCVCVCVCVSVSVCVMCVGAGLRVCECGCGVGVCVVVCGVVHGCGYVLWVWVCVCAGMGVGVWEVREREGEGEGGGGRG